MRTLLLISLGLLAQLPQIFAIESVTITRAIPSNGHLCVSRCLWYTIFEDLGAAMGCGTPYDNNCFCATGSDAFTSADDHLQSCASERCSKGDIPQDLSSMRSIYASYCMGAGFTQAGATQWFNPAEATRPPTSGDDDEGEGGEGSSSGPGPAPSQTDNSGPVRTTTQTTIVTQTTEGGAATQSVVTVHQTSTAWVHPDGSPAKAPGSASDTNDDSTWKIAVGVTIPVVVILAIAAWFLWRRRRRQRQRQWQQTSVVGNPPEQVQPQPSATPMIKTTITRKPVTNTTVSPLSHSSQPTEMTGDGVLQELAPQGVDVIPTAPPAYTGGVHETLGQTEWPENRVHNSRFAEVSGDGIAMELPGAYQNPRPELPGSGQFHRS